MIIDRRRNTCFSCLYVGAVGLGAARSGYDERNKADGSKNITFEVRIKMMSTGYSRGIRYKYKYEYS